LTGKSIAKQLLLFVIPIWLGTFFQQLYNTADAIFVGNFVGKAALAAVGGPSAQIVTLLINVFVDLAAGSSVIISQYFGAHSDREAGKAIHTAMSIALIGGIVLTAAGLIFSPMLLRAMNAEGEIYTLSVKFLSIYFSGTIFLTVYNLGSAVLRALGDSKHPFYFLVCGCISNIVLDFVLIYWAHMGVAGAATATVISQALAAGLVVRELRRLPGEYKLYLRKITIYPRILRNMFKIGIPEAMQSILYSISNILIQANIDGFGTDTIAAMTAYGKVDMFFWMTMDAFGMAITTMAGQFYGAGRVSGVKKSVRICLIICTGAALVLSAALLLGGRVLFSMFTTDLNVVAIGLQVQHMLVPFYFIFFCVVVLSGALRGMGHSFVPMLITLVGICLLRIVWLYTIVPINPVLTTTLFSYPVTWSLTALAFVVYYRRIIKIESRLECPEI